MKKCVGKRKCNTYCLPRKFGASRRGFAARQDTVPFQNHIIPFFLAYSWHRQRFWQAFPIWGFPVKVKARFCMKETKYNRNPPPHCPYASLAWCYFPLPISRANTLPAHPWKPLGTSYFPSERSVVLEFDISSIDQPLRQ